MNKERRNALAALSGSLSSLAACLPDEGARNPEEAAILDAFDWASPQAELRAGRDALEALRQEEQDYFDAMPEAFQQADKGEQAQAAVDAMDKALADLRTAVGCCEIDDGRDRRWEVSGYILDAVSYLDDAQN